MTVDSLLKRSESENINLKSPSISEIVNTSEEI